MQITLPTGGRIFRGEFGDRAYATWLWTAVNPPPQPWDRHWPIGPWLTG
jgi:hypothetical protein